MVYKIILLWLGDRNSFYGWEYCSLSECPWAREKNIHSAGLGNRVLANVNYFKLLLVLIKTSYWHFFLCVYICLINYWERRTVISKFSCSLVNYPSQFLFSFCFIYFEVLLLVHSTFRITIYFWPYYHYEVFIFMPGNTSGPRAYYV